MRAPGPIVFFGTPDFAVPTLDALFLAGLAPTLVVTQPARPAGRGRKVVEPPVARRARELELPVSLVESVKTAEFQVRLEEFKPWVGVVVAFGQIFPSSLLELPAVGCVNVHASLLPNYRGAAPVQAAIAAGDLITGVTTMQMDAGLDSGPILLQEEIAIGALETTPQLAERLAVTGAGLLVETLERFAKGSIQACEQDRDLVTYAPKLSRDDAVIDWSRPAHGIFNSWRAYLPWPGLVTSLRSESVKVRRCGVVEDRFENVEPGTIVAAGPDLQVACGGGSVLGLDRLQRPGRAPLDASDFVNGERLLVGEVFEQA
jgi:methionyl-tRNA formyltransferase